MTTPNHLSPDGSITGYGSWSTVQHRTQSEWEAGEYNKWAAAMAGIPKIGDKLAEIPVIGGALSDFWEIITGIPDSDENDAGSLIRDMWSNLGSVTSLVNTHDDEIIDLQDKTQVLENVIGYGAAYMSTATSGSLGTNYQLMRFGQQTGPAVGCRLEDGEGWVLDSRGLWRIDAQMSYDTYLIGALNTEFELRVYTPDKSTVFHYMYAQDDTKQGVTMNTQLHVAVPTAGYHVRVYARAGAGRGFLGGPNRTYLNVFKLSAETS